MPASTGNLQLNLARRAASHTLLLAIGIALGSLTSRPVAAQGVSVKASVPDSVAFIVRREPFDVGEARLRTRDRNVTLLLMDTTLVLQLTQRGYERIDQGISDSAPQSAGGRFLARMVGAGLGELLDHGIAYRLSALREARAEGSHLILLDRDGHKVFDKVEVNGRNVLDDIAPDDARRFAAEVNRAIRRQR